MGVRSVRKQIANIRYGRLVAIKFVIHNGSSSMWLCRCDCGNERVISQTNLTLGHSKSCGCLRTEMVVNRTKKHNKTRTIEWQTWVGIRVRCYKKNDISYKNYGGRGIKVCDRWLQSFENFFEDMGLKPSKSHSLDRIDNNGNYEPGNCRWATKKEQGNNKRNNVKFLFKDRHLTASELSEETGINASTIRNRHRLGFNNEDLVYIGSLKAKRTKEKHYSYDSVRKIPLSEWSIISELFTKGTSINEISLRYNVYPSTIYKGIKKYCK